jgi:parallel beta-helix repeat protein
MADPITWYALGRTVTDTQTILEAVDAKILTHNLDPSAHGQENESLYEHRAAELLDHLSYSIYNIKLNPAARVYKAIVGSGLESDFATIQAAIDWANLYGGGRILIKQGTYHVPGNLTLYSNIILEGEDAELTILDFDNRLCHIDIIGTSRNHKRNVEFRNIQFANAGNTDNTFIRGSYADDCVIENCKFYNIHDAAAADTVCIGLTYCQRFNIENNYFDTCDQALNFTHCNFIKCEFNYLEDCGSTTLAIYYSPNVIFRHNNTLRCGTTGQDTMIYFTENSNNLVIDSNMFEDCKTQAIWNEVGSKVSITNNVFTRVDTTYNAISLNNCDRVVLANNRIYGWAGDGIYFGDDVDYSTIVANIITNCGGYGVNIDAATCNKNVVVGNALISNTAGAYRNTGTGSVIASNSS